VLRLRYSLLKKRLHQTGIYKFKLGAIDFEVYRFHDRIIEVPDGTEHLMLSANNLNEYKIVDYRISVRKKDDYTVIISGVVQVRKQLKTVTDRTNKYYYKTIRVYDEVS